MSQLDEFNQNNLLFKRFQGVIQTNIINPNSFNNEFGKPSLVNTYNDTIFSSNVSRDLSSNTTVLNLTLQLPGAPSVIDTSANSWQTCIYGEYADLKTADNIAITNLKFYQKVFLKSISSGPYAWWLIDPSNALQFTTNNLLKDMIPFSYGTTGATYSPVVWYYTGTVPSSSATAQDAEILANNPSNWTPDFNQNSTPLYWLVDYASGVLQFYAQADTNGHIPTINGNKIKPTTPNNYIGGKPDPTSVPRISFIKYIGDKGAAPIGGGGSDISGIDISNIQINLEKLDRMILPDGYVDISGTDYDLCGNEVVRTYYTYNRAQMFVGYDNLPILDGSAVNHLQDPSHNNIPYELDVSGSLYVSNNTLLNDVSCSNLDVSNNLIVLGHSLLNDVSCSNLDISNNLIVLGHSLLNDVSCSNLDVSGQLYMNCNNILDVSNIYFCNTSAILGQSPGVLTISGDLDMSMNQITTIADATDNSGVPSWGQVQSLVLSGAGSYWIQSGTDLYYNTGTVGINTTTLPLNNLYKLDVSGSTNVAENLFVSMTPNQSIVSMDKNLYTRNTNLIDTLKIPYEIFYDQIWKPMIKANESGNYVNPSTGQVYNLSSQNPGKPQAVPTFASAWGPCVIPIAYLDINQNYGPTPFEPTNPLGFQTSKRPHIANTSAYFTIKFAQPYDLPSSSSAINWEIATGYFPNGSFKSGLGAITEQTITFEAGYIDSYQLSSPNGSSADVRNPKPFIKVISTNIGNLKCLTGITVRPDPINPTVPANINDLTQNMQYYGFDIETPKIGGICRIIIAESCPGNPAHKSIQNKAWLLLEQQWNVEPWQGSTASDNEKLIKGLVAEHIIDVRMYANNLGDLNLSRNPPFINEYNTDWQLVTFKQLTTKGDYSWDKFVLPMGNFANPPVFNIPTSPPVTDIPYTLMVGGTQCPDPTTGSIPSPYPSIIYGANLWEVWLNLINWPYGITTTEEVFENNVDICGNVIIDGTTNAQAIFATDITCNNLDALNSIDVGPNQKLTIIEDKITSTTTASSPLDGLKIEANNIYIKFNPWTSAGGATPAGITMDLGDSTSNTQFRMRDVVGSKLFSVEGSGLMQTQNIYPFTNMTYNIGYKGPNPTQDLRYENLYIGNIDTSGNVDINGDLTVDGNVNIEDLSATNIDVSNNLNVSGHTLVTDLSATNIDVSNNLNVEGLITGVGGTVFVEYRDYTADIIAGTSNWYCIARTKDTNSGGGADNARGLFILDDNTSGRRQQIIFYAGTSYSRGNYINVIANNWYGSTPTITKLKLETGGIYDGTNLYIYRQSTTVADSVYVRLYENTRISNTGGEWELTATPIPGLTTTSVELDLTYNPNNHRANAVSSLDTLLYSDFIVKPPNNDSNNVIDVDREAIRVNYGGYDYTSSTNPIAAPTIGGKNAIDRIIVDLQAGSSNFNNSVANSGSVMTTKGGIKILPLQTGIGGSQGPAWGASLFLGEYGFGAYPTPITARSQRTGDGKYRPASGNVYCNAVRQNVVFSNNNNTSEGTIPWFPNTYQGNGTIFGSSMYYNGGDVRYIIIDPRNGVNGIATVTLPKINEPMLGQAITVARTTTPINFTNYQAAVIIKADSTDKINCPHSIYIDATSFSGIAIDPYSVIPNGGGSGYNRPNPYKANEICSVTLVASQNGYYNTVSSPTFGSSITNQYVWQFISSGGPGI